MDPGGTRGPRAPTLRERLAAAAFGAASTALSALPRSVTIPAARALGAVGYALLPARRRVALDNLACTHPDMPARERRAVALRSFGHAVAIGADLLTLPRVARAPREHCEVAPGSLEALERARAGGRGVILVAGHFGLMESMGILLGAAGHPVAFVAKPFDNPALDAVVRRVRGATGNVTIHKGGAKDRARAVLERGGLVAIVADQHVTTGDREWIPFFGLPAATTRSLATLALETGAPIVPIHAFPLPGGRCRCEFGPVVDPAAAAGSPPDPRALLRVVIGEMEAAARRDLPAWLWLHRRWKVRRDDAPERYPSYSVTESQERRLRRLRARRAGVAGAEPEPRPPA